jgi:hypothetical protein
VAGRSQRDAERQLILVHSTVWIDYFKGTITRQTEMLDRKSCRASRTKETINEARKMLTSLIVVELGGQGSRFKRRKTSLRKLGVAVRKTLDTVIATRCIESGYDFLHNDRDFDPFAKHLRLRTVVSEQPG